MGKLAVLIGKRIKEIRKEKGLKQEDMESLGINYKYYQKIETGKVNITLDTVEKVTKAFNMDVREFFILPLDKSKEINELSALIAKIIKKKDKKSVKKLNLFIKEILP
ncbi:MAG: helix-turn-helix transcriptional regulator [Deltaproteobacteria bacterium]|nr:helix-turn-helix transcriptional regulator [Deltaproteobacteria bacterium]